MYRNLDPAKIVDTAKILNQRISERFPDSGLGRVTAELLSVAEESAAVSKWLSKPHLLIRTLAWLSIMLLVGILLALLSTAVRSVSPKPVFSSVAELLSGFDAAVNEAVLMSLAIFFLFTLETRIKRAKALKAIHVLRSIAHIIDMHQLTKDPERITQPENGVDTSCSRKHTLSRFQLARYLDYCSEALSVIGKLAALYVQKFDDPVTLSAVNDVEDLTSGLSRKIWQKIMILENEGFAHNRQTHGEANRT